MKKILAATVAVIALAAAVPLVASAGSDWQSERSGDNDGMMSAGMMGAGMMDDEDDMDRGHGDWHHGGRDHGDMHRGMMGHHGMGGHGMDRDGGGHRHGVKAKIRIQEFLDTYDTNGDGQVTQDEVDQWRADRLAKFDADGNGQLSLDEYQQLWLDAMHERMVRQFQSHDADGDGQVTTDEFGKRTAHMVMMGDRNDDGAISLDDLGRRHGDRDHGAMKSDNAEPQAGQPGDASGQPPMLPNSGTGTLTVKP